MSVSALRSKHRNWVLQSIELRQTSREILFWSFSVGGDDNILPYLCGVLMLRLDCDVGGRRLPSPTEFEFEALFVDLDSKPLVWVWCSFLALDFGLGCSLVQKYGSNVVWLTLFPSCYFIWLAVFLLPIFNSVLKNLSWLLSNPMKWFPNTSTLFGQPVFPGFKHPLKATMDMKTSVQTQTYAIWVEALKHNLKFPSNSVVTPKAFIIEASLKINSQAGWKNLKSPLLFAHSSP